ncbi:MAG TPA: ATP-binding protein [Aliarcobacter thereius]|uniref:AAA family ATPase n=1 Tax=Aliarcobacter thereius TaxID=544718 RepID=UPI0010FED627|nr:AAA family ATPase [Aliarcobacter thereius]TLT06169.1 ATP-binding protein [Aliarcobacter thereius]HJE02689.1 ATP-binding protein [Aliarcobacter thereius]
MKLLSENYEQNFVKINFLERKKKIENKKTLIIGAYKVGKSYLIMDFISNFEKKELLYIDFSDLRNIDIEDELAHLQDFIDKHNISILVLDNFPYKYFPLNCENIVISSHKDINIEGFSKIYLGNLDFEEYLLFDNKQLNITSSFNSFLKFGSFAETIFLEENKRVQRVQEIIKQELKDNTEFMAFKLLLENIDEKKSIFQLFNSLKSKIKISKDRFYELCKNFEEQNIFFFVEKFNQKNSSKKIYSYNHALQSSFSFQKRFKQEFSNMIFLELNDRFKTIYYIDFIDFYIPEISTAILVIPFFNEATTQNLMKKVIKTCQEFNIKELEIVTISNSGKIKNSSIKIEIFSFFEWALS